MVPYISIRCQYAALNLANRYCCSAFMICNSFSLSRQGMILCSLVFRSQHCHLFTRGMVESPLAMLKKALIRLMSQPLVPSLRGLQRSQSSLLMLAQRSASMVSCLPFSQSDGKRTNCPNPPSNTLELGLHSFLTVSTGVPCISSGALSAVLCFTMGCAQTSQSFC